MIISILDTPPDNWESVRFRKILESTNYGTSNKSNSNQNGIPVLRIPNVIGDMISLKNLKFVKLDEKEFRTLKLDIGDILVVRTNGNPNYVGRCALVEELPSEMVYASYLIRIRYSKNKVYPKFLIYFLQSEMARKQFRMRTRTSAGNYNINTQGISSIKILLPPLPEQLKIASILSNVDAIIQSTQQLIAQLQTLKRGLMQRLFTEGLGHTEFQETKVGRIPKEWKVVRIDSISTAKTTSINPTEFQNEQFYYYSIPAYMEGKKPTITVGSDIKSNKYVIENNMILFGKLNPRVEKVWLVNSIDDRRKIGSTEWICILPDPDMVDIRYLYYLLYSCYVMPKAKLLVSGTTPSRQRVLPKEFMTLRVPLPDMQEQDNISKIFINLDAMIENESRYLDRMKTTKIGLMQQLLTGNTRVKV